MTIAVEMLHWADKAIAVAIIFTCIQMSDRVNRATRHIVRVAILGLLIGAGAQIFGGWREFGEWPQTLLLGSALVFMLANMREPMAIPGARWANRAAWAAAGGVLMVLGLALAETLL